MQIELKKIHMENFKIFQNKTIDLGDITKISAENYKGKSSITDAFNWVLFGKSSTGNSEGKQFHPRRYDEDGKDIDYVDIVVELLLVVDGKEILICKTQKQKWVRKRGSEEKTYEGDTNEYEWNGVPVSETEHKKRVAEIIQEDVFRKITNPHAFTSMDQKLQRKFLLEKVANITDADVFEADEGFEELKELTKEHTIEEVRAINKKALSKYKKEQTEIPVRIDEVSKSIVEIDITEQEKQLDAYKKQLEEVEEQIASKSKGYEEVNRLKNEIAEYEGKIADIERAEKRKLQEKRNVIKDKINEADNEFNKLFNKQKQIERELESKASILKSNEDYLAKLGNDYKTEKAKELDQSTMVCPTCHQELPQDEKDKLVDNFASDKAARLLEINQNGKSVADSIKKDKVEIEELEKQLEQIKADKITVDGTKNKLTEELNSLPSEIDLSNNEDYKSLNATLKALENSLNALNTQSEDDVKKALQNRKGEIQGEINKVNQIIAGKKAVEDAKERVKELKEELKETTQKVADCERLEFMLEKFEKSKMDLLSERINKKFKLVQWKLWHQQKNGGFEPVCVCMVHGSVYGENTTSTTERLMAGLDIISTLQEIYDTKAPIFIDNKESYNDWNIPQMDCQMVLLSVSDDKDLRVEVE